MNSRSTLSEFSLSFIGALPDDPEAYPRTVRALNKLNPDAIVVDDWAGDAYQEWLEGVTFRNLQNDFHDAIAEVFKEFGIDVDLGNSIPFGVGRAASDYARTHSGVRLFPTESADEKIKSDLECLNDIKGIQDFYRFMLTHYPGQLISFNPDLYVDFESHIDGVLPYNEVKSWFGPEFFDPERVLKQFNALNDYVWRLNGPENHEVGRFVHIGNIDNLIDDKVSPDQRVPVNLWQYMNYRFPLETARYSLSSF